MGLRIRLEVVANNSNHLHTLSGIKTGTGPRSALNDLNSDRNTTIGNNQNINNIGKNGNNGNDNNGNERSSWVADVGVGKEWEKIVGYWRFSDMLKYGDLGFLNSGIPGSRSVFLDLSKYGIPLEIFGGLESRSKVRFCFFVHFFFLLYVYVFSHLLLVILYLPFYYSLIHLYTDFLKFNLILFFFVIHSKN